MADKEIKTFLKDARDLIKAKEFKSALKEVKKVLNKDKSNYMGLVFCGLCLSELDQPEQALQAYRRATDSNPDQTIAWEGLLKYYEKNSSKSDYSGDHINVLKKLVNLAQEDKEKHFDLCLKLADLQLSQLDLTAAIDTLQTQGEVCRDSEEKHRSSLQQIVRVLSQQPDLDEKLSSVYEASLDGLINENGSIENMENLKHMIKLTYKRRKVRKLTSTAVRMVSLFPGNIYPLEWICKIYLEWAAETLDFECEAFSDPSPYYTKLLELSTNSTLGHLARAAHTWRTGETDAAILALREALDGATSTNFYGLYILAKAEYEAGQISAVEISAPKAISYLTKVKEVDVRAKLQQELVLLSVKAYYQHSSQEKLTAALKLLEDNSMSETKCEELSVIRAKLFAALGMREEVEEMLLNYDFGETNAQLITALLLRSENRLDESLTAVESCLNLSPDCFDALILMGQLCWEEQRISQCLPCFLKAAKLEPGSWSPFLYLGHYYRHLNTPEATEKSRKCYQKCLQLNPSSVEAGMALSDIFRLTGKQQENLALLTEVTGRVSASSGQATWAWLRLGVHYLTEAADQPSLAVKALQSALRSDSTNVNCWEALADAYMARGSFVAAQKAFEKALTLSPGSLYASLMIAGIKHRLNKWHDAAKDYRAILATNPDYLPALRGLAETLIALGQNYVDQHVDKNAVNCAEEAVGVLTAAAKQKPSMAGTWRLLGDSCSMLAALPDNVAVMNVPGDLIATADTGDSDSNSTIRMGRVEVLELGARCYTRAINLNQENWGTWHQLGLVYLALHRGDRLAGHGEKAFKVLQHAVRLQPGNHTLWNSLGVLSCHMVNWPMAQHCFISSLNIENNSPAWTGLGVLYLKVGHAHLANKAFKEAQNQEPSYLRGWAGQALVAEIAGYKSESMDLFRHCTLLGPEQESAIGYANWVCSTLQAIEEKGGVDEVEPHNRYIVERMHGVAVAADSLTRYCLRQPRDSLAHCQLAIILERQGLCRGSLQAAETARNLLQEEQLQQEEGGGTGIDISSRLDAVNTNLGRIYAKLGRYDEAVVAYTAVTKSSLHSQVGLALAYFSLQKWRESYEAYESSLHWLADNDGLKSHVLVAMGNLAYKVEGVAAAKTLLFQSCQLQPPSVRGLLALCVIGIQNSDMSLIEAALAELSAHRTDPRHAADVAFLRAAVTLLTGDAVGARRQLLRSAREQPWLAGMWRAVSVFLLQNSPGEGVGGAAVSRRAALMEQSAVQVGKIISAPSNSENETASSLLVETLSHLSARRQELARGSAKRLCHLYPNLPSSWSLLAATAEKTDKWRSAVLEYVAEHGEGNLSEWARKAALAGL